MKKISILLITLFLTVYSYPAYAVDQVLTGSVADGNLIVTIRDDGSMNVQQYQATVAEGRIENSNLKGSFLHVNGNDCGLGLLSTTNQTQVSNTTTGNSVTTTINCPNLTFQQKTTYINGTNLVFYTWTITNTSATTLPDIRFFHGQDNQLGTSDTGGGYANVSRNFIAFREFSGPSPVVIGLRSDLPIHGFQADSFTSLPGSILTNHALNNTAITGDGSYALEWRQSQLLAGEQFVIRGYERFEKTSGYSLDTIEPASPLAVLIQPGATITLPISLYNYGGGDVTMVSSSTSLEDSVNWSISGSTPSAPFTITSLTATNFQTTITANPALSPGVFTNLIATFTSQFSNIISEKVLLVVDVPPPTPTPTPTPTSPPSPPSLTVLSPGKSTGAPFPRFIGTAPMLHDVTVLVDGTVIGVNTADASGFWEVLSITQLALGPHVLVVQAKDPNSAAPAIETKPFTFTVTGGADLDFDGDGVTDLTSYSRVGNSVVFKWKKSSTQASVTTSVEGAVPATEDYDGDHFWDFATISREGTNLIWRIRPSIDPSIFEESFGEVGERPMTGCSFILPRVGTLAVIQRDKRVRAKLLGAPDSELSGIITSEEVIGCNDINQDGIDEVITAQEIEGSKFRITAHQFNGEKAGSVTVGKFDRGFVINDYKNESSLYAMVRLLSASERSARIIGGPPNAQVDVSVSLPRKLIVSSGTILEGDGTFGANIIWQNLKNGSLKRKIIDDESEAKDFGKLAKQSNLLQPFYIFETKRR